MAIQTMTCRTCQGCGKETLPPSWAETLADIRKHPWSNPEEVYKRMPHSADFTRSAINNRLTRLLDAGLLKRERHGKEFRYAVCHNHKNK